VTFGVPGEQPHDRITSSTGRPWNDQGDLPTREAAFCLDRNSSGQPNDRQDGNDEPTQTRMIFHNLFPLSFFGRYLS
jgi:hypothetical protein